MAHTIMIIRHAEKPIPGHVQGVRQRGESDPGSLSVRGWQRAGALVGFFMRPHVPGIRVPQHLMAAAHDRSGGSGSRRSHQTLEPLGQAMGLDIDASLDRHQQAQAAERSKALEGAVLIAWSHECIPALARAIAPGLSLPEQWGDDCFDRVWLFEQDGSGWRFSERPQGLLAGDAAALD